MSPEELQAAIRLDAALNERESRPDRLLDLRKEYHRKVYDKRGEIAVYIVSVCCFKVSSYSLVDEFKARLKSMCKIYSLMFNRFRSLEMITKPDTKNHG